MIKIGNKSIDRAWFMHRTIHNKDNTMDHFNLINEWILRLYGIDGYYQVSKKVITDKEFATWCKMLDFKVEQYRGEHELRYREL